MVQVKIRPAQDEDIPFLAWVMYTAARSHLAECPWDKIFAEPEKRTRVLLKRMSQTVFLPWSYVSNFRIAEVGGVSAAAMCGFDPVTEVTPAMADLELGIVKQEFGYTDERLADIRERLGIAALGFPDDLPDCWGIENVAVLPQFRGQGVIDHLFEYVFDEGRQQGFKQAQIMSLIGNDNGLRTFERNGFKPVSRKTNPAFDELFGTPGAVLLARDL